MQKCFYLGGDNRCFNDYSVGCKNFRLFLVYFCIESQLEETVLGSTWQIVKIPRNCPINALKRKPEIVNEIQSNANDYD